VTADNFNLPNRDEEDLPPFVTIKHVTAEVFPPQLLRRPVHLSRVKLDGLIINVPPKGGRRSDGEEPQARNTRLSDFVIDRVDGDGTRLYVFPKQQGREPMEWELRALTLRSAGTGSPCDSPPHSRIRNRRA
jgi:hypothetical protein